MNSEDKNNQEIQRRQRELEAREQAIRLRELEAEINQSIVYEPVKYQEPERRVKLWGKKLGMAVRFLGIVIVVGVAVKVASWLATAVIVGGISWIAYKIFFEKEPPNNQ